MGARDSFQNLRNIPIIDADTHYSEPYDLWTSRAPADWKDRVPRRAKVDGVDTWVLDNRNFGFAGPASCIRKDGSKAYGNGFRGMQLKDVHQGAHDPKARVAYMDAEGIQAQIVYPNLLGFGNSKALEFEPKLRSLCTTIYNDAMAEMQAGSGERLLPMALIPYWDIKESVAEIRRARKMGLRGVAMNSDPQEVGLPSLRDRSWDPVWEALSELKMPVNFHIGSSQTQNSWFGITPWPDYPDDEKLAIGSTMMFFGNARVLGNLIFSGVLERFPALNFVSVESGLGWIPFMLDALEYQAGQLGEGALKQLSMSPSAYFRRQIYACFWFERKGLKQIVDSLGADNILFETDFPHPTCLYPNGLESANEALAPLPVEERRKILYGNAARLYAL
jgi:predicted TIM-barrel fold metal-dependent hydrolase